MRHFTIKEDIFQTQCNEFFYLTKQFILFICRHIKKIHRFHDDWTQGNIPFAVKQYIQDTNCLTAQCIWILRACRNQTTAKCSNDVIDFVDNGQHFTSFCLRQYIACKTRQILFKNSFRYFWGFTVK